MTFKTIQTENGIIAEISAENTVITDPQSAIDLLISAKYEADTKYLVIAKELIAEEFFVLSSGLAGEVLQKFINYGGKLAIYGDYSRYTSKPLKDFIYESNKGRDVFFAKDSEEAFSMLARVI